MAMNRLIEGLRGMGDYGLAQRQAEILEELRRRYPIDDAPLKGKFPPVSSIEVITISLSVETQKLVERMQNDGYAVYNTVGKTPISLEQEGMRYSYLKPALWNVTATPSLLAFKTSPQEFFLRGSQNIRHERQLELLEEERERVEKQYPNAGLIVREGKFPEWTELAFKHWEEAGVKITGRNYGFECTWTGTYESDKPGADRASVGSWFEATGLEVFLWNPDRVDPKLRLAPLVEIPRK